MGRYVSVHQTPAGANKTIIHVHCDAGATARPMIHHFVVGSDASPANHAGEFVLAATTVLQTGGSSLTRRKIDPAMPPALCPAVGGAMTEPTYGDIFIMFGLNQQATFQWWANPGFEPRIAISATGGIGLKSVEHTSTPNMNGTLMWEE